MAEQNGEQEIFQIRDETAVVGFAAEEMRACPACGRMNAPNRPKCMYCAEVLELEAAHIGDAGLRTRRPESDANAFNVVIAAVGEKFDANAAARLLGRDAEAVGSSVAAGCAVPVGRYETEREAAVICERLGEIGAECRLVSDESLRAAVQPRRLRRIEANGGAIAVFDFNTNERIEFAAANLLLVVTGTIVETRTETAGKRKGKTVKIDDTAETVSDMPVMDLYFPGDETGCRVVPHGFDFSCLGDEKGMLAAENFAKLKERLKQAAPSAQFVENYAKLRGAIGDIWEIEERRDSGGLTRQYGKLGFEKVTAADNRTQFAKFSRLQRQFL